MSGSSSIRSAGTPTGPTLSRRHLARQAGLVTAGVAALAVPGLTAAQATPGASPAASPAAGGDVTFTLASPSRADATARIMAAYPFDEPGADGGDLIQVHTGDIKTLNPVLRSDIASSWITGLIFESLIGVSVVEGELIPALADSWEISSDGLRVRFHLNPDAAWHDGKPVTAEDVTYSLDAVLAEDGLSPNRTDILRAVSTYSALDDKTVEVVANGPSATFIYQVGTLAIVPKHIWEGVPFADWGTAPGTTASDPTQVIGSGPFRFVEWVQEDHVTVERYPDYWLADQKPHIDRYIYRVVADATSSIQTLQTGESDIMVLSPAQAPAFIRDNPDIPVFEHPRAHMTYYVTNLHEDKTPLFEDVRVRQAMMWALDRDLMVETIWAGYAVRADGPQPPLSPAYAPDEITSIYTFDPDKANALLDEAGWTRSGDNVREKDGVKFSFEFIYDDPSAINQQLIPYLQQAWQAVGIEIVPKAMPVPALIDAYMAGTFTAGMLGFEFGIDGNQGGMYRADAVPPSGFNFMGYANADYDALDDQQLAELDPEKRRALLIEQSNILAADLPNGPLVFGKGVSAALPRVHNYFSAQYSSLWSIPWIWIAE
ncbi:MAG: ABC transporter substrate-binding protein [Thermomicrobiales bacterium]